MGIPSQASKEEGVETRHGEPKSEKIRLRYSPDHKQQFEGLKLTAYQDSVGIWTIGFGNIFNLDTGKPIKQGDVITQDTADRWLKIEVDQLQAKLQKVITVPLSFAICPPHANMSFAFSFFRSLFRLKCDGMPSILVCVFFPRWTLITIL